MNTKQTKREFIALKVIALTLSLLVLAGVALYCFTTRPGTYTVYADDGYYSETTYYLTEAAYNTYLAEQTLNDVRADSVKTLAKSASRQANTISVSSDPNIKFISATVKTVWVSEKSDENGVITDSHLMTEEEVSAVEGFRNHKEGINAELLWMPQETDEEEQYYLSIRMVLYRDYSEDQYIVQGNARWEAILTGDSNKAAQENYWDYLAITWGGERLLCGDEHEISGYYYNEDEVSFHRDISDSYAGYSWHFNEKSGWMGKEMELCTAVVRLNDSIAPKGLETNAKVTYVHTYGNIGGSLSFSMNSNGVAAASVNLQETEKQWQIEIDTPGIKY